MTHRSSSTSLACPHSSLRRARRPGPGSQAAARPPPNAPPTTPASRRFASRPGTTTPAAPVAGLYGASTRPASNRTTIASPNEKGPARTPDLECRTKKESLTAPSSLSAKTPLVCLSSSFQMDRMKTQIHGQLTSVAAASDDATREPTQRSSRVLLELRNTTGLFHLRPRLRRDPSRRRDAHLHFVRLRDWSIPRAESSLSEKSKTTLAAAVPSRREVREVGW